MLREVMAWTLEERERLLAIIAARENITRPAEQ